MRAVLNKSWRQHPTKQTAVWPSHGRAKVGRPARIYLQQLCTDTGCSRKDLPGAMDDRDGL